MLEDPRTLATRAIRRTAARASRLDALTPAALGAITPRLTPTLQAGALPAQSHTASASTVESISAASAQTALLLFSRFISWTSRRPALTVLMASTVATSTNVMVAISQVTCSRCWFTKVLPAALGPTVIGLIATSSTWVISRTKRARQALDRARQRFQK